MNIFKWPLLILILLTGLALAGYIAGLFPGARPPTDAIQVTLEQHGADRTLRIRLANTDTRTHWHKTADRYRVDVQRRGPDLYQFDIALIDPHTDRSRRLHTSARVDDQSVTLGGFTLPASGNNQGPLRHDRIVIEAH